MQILMIVLGFLAFFLAWAFIFKTRLIFRFNAWMRDRIFTDRWVLFSGRRLGILFLILGAISLFSGIEVVTRRQGLKPRIAAKILNQAQSDFAKEDYERVILRLGEMLRADPQNLVAKELVAASLYAMGEKDRGYQMMREILEADPKYPVGKGPLGKFFKKKKGENK